MPKVSTNIFIQWTCLVFSPLGIWTLFLYQECFSPFFSTDLNKAHWSLPKSLVPNFPDLFSRYCKAIPCKIAFTTMSSSTIELSSQWRLSLHQEFSPPPLYLGSGFFEGKEHALSHFPSITYWAQMSRTWWESWYLIFAELNEDKKSYICVPVCMRVSGGDLCVCLYAWGHMKMLLECTVINSDLYELLRKLNYPSLPYIITECLNLCEALL